MKIAKWGNSLAVRIPKDVADALGLRLGDNVSIQAGEGVLRIDREVEREGAIRSLRRFRGTMPSNYRFDRDDANER